MEPKRLRGRVKFYATHKGFGFVCGEDGKDYFFHANDIGGLVLAAGDKIEFSLRQANKGPVCVDVVRIWESPEAGVQHRSTACG